MIYLSTQASVEACQRVVLHIRASLLSVLQSALNGENLQSTTYTVIAVSLTVGCVGLQPAGFVFVPVRTGVRIREWHIRVSHSVPSLSLDSCW